MEKVYIKFENETPIFYSTIFTDESILIEEGLQEVSPEFRDYYIENQGFYRIDPNKEFIIENLVELEDIHSVELSYQSKNEIEELLLEIVRLNEKIVKIENELEEQRQLTELYTENYSSDKTDL